MKLSNVLHVLEIRKNLVSASLLYKAGIKAVLESDKLILTKGGMFIGKGYSCNGMFKLSIMNKNTSSVYSVVSSDLWHLRTTHVNFRTLKLMFYEWHD